MPSWWDAHHFEFYVLYVHLLLLMFVVGFIITIIIIIFFYLFLSCYYNCSDILVYESVHIEVNKFCVCSLTTTPSIFRYTSSLYKEFLKAKGSTVNLFVHTVYILPLPAQPYNCLNKQINK